MKRSLGRRSSSRNPPRTTTFTEFGSACQDRKSGIPVRRAASSDRNMMATPLTKNMLLVTPVSKRATSEDRNSMITYSAMSQGGFRGGTERPSRATTLSTNSVRHSSYGGARSKRDNRPIEDKEWQMAAQKRVENFLRPYCQSGLPLLNNGCSLKPITVTSFISIIDVLLRQLDGNEERTYINKENYVQELPFVMKKLLYRGKIEKSWLISVNTVRSWPHVLACIDFLVSCVQSQTVIDPFAVMFPDLIDKDEDDFWDYKVLLPYFLKSFTLHKSNDPNYEEIQKQYDREVIEDHVCNDNVFDRINIRKNEITRIRKETESMNLHSQKVLQSLQQMDVVFNNLKDEKSKYEEYIDGYNKFMKDSKNRLESMDRHIEKLSEELERTQNKIYEMQKNVNNQKLTQAQLAELRQRRDSLQREIKREEEYVNTYEELIHQNSLEVLSQKKKIDDLIKKYNIEVIKYLPYAFENALDAKHGEEEINKRLEVVQEAISSAKLGLQSLSDTNSSQMSLQLQNELEILKRKYVERKNKLKAILDKNINTIKEKEELIKKLKDEIDNLLDKINNLKNDPEAQNNLEEKLKLADKMERQLAMLKSNATLCMKEYQQLLEEFSEKHKSLDEEFHKKVNNRRPKKS